MARGAAVLGIAASAAVLFACSTFGASPATDVVDVTDTADGGRREGDDARLDGGAPDAPSFCTSVDADLCLDFESAPAPEWVTFDEPGEGELQGAVEETLPPGRTGRALRARLPATPAGASTRAVREYWSEPARDVHVEADVFVPAATFTGSLNVLAVFFGAQETTVRRCAVNVVVDLVDGEPRASVNVGLGAELRNVLPHRFRLDAWQRVVLDVRIAGPTGTPGTVTMSVAGDVATGAVVERALPAAPSRTRLLLGVHRYLPNDGGPMFEAYYDDVVVRSLGE